MVTEVTTTKDSLVQIVKAEPKKYSQAELGRLLRVSRERVHDLVKGLDLHDLVKPKQWTFHHCLDCGKPILHGATRCWECWLKIYGAKWVTLSCDSCGKKFERKESEARRHKLHFCSTSCRNSYGTKSAKLAKVIKPVVAPAEFKMPLLEPSPGGLKLRTKVFELYKEYYPSLVQVARAMGISNSEIYRVRRGERAINEKFIIGTLKAFPGYKLDDLFYVVADGSEMTGSKCHKSGGKTR